MSSSTYNSFLAAKRRQIQQLLAAGEEEGGSSAVDYVSPLEASTLGVSERAAAELQAPSQHAPARSTKPIPHNTTKADTASVAIPATARTVGRLSDRVSQAGAMKATPPRPSKQTSQKAPMPTNEPKAADESALYGEEMHIPVSTQQAEEMRSSNIPSMHEDAKGAESDEAKLQNVASVDASADLKVAWKADAIAAGGESSAHTTLVRSASPIQSPVKRSIRDSTRSQPSVQEKAEHHVKSPDRASSDSFRASQTNVRENEESVGEVRTPTRSVAPAPPQQPIASHSEIPGTATTSQPSLSSPNIRKFLLELENDISIDTPDIVRRDAPSVTSRKPIEIPADAPAAPPANKAHITAMQFELDEKTRQVAILRAQLRQAQKTMASQLDERERQHEARLKQQQEEFEAALSKHVKFIDTLLNDKNILASQVAALTEQLATVSKAAETKLSAVPAIIKEHVEKAREQWEANEKSRREKWQQIQLKELRERTLRGLEPEINRMIEKHKEEIRQLQHTAAEQMDVMKAALAEEKDRAVKQARKEYASAADSLTENEKLLWRQREQHLREEFEDHMSAVRTKYTNELDEERKRATESIRDMQQKHFSDVQTLQAEFQSRIAAVLDNQTRERQEWMRKANEEHAAWKQKAEEDRKEHSDRLTSHMEAEFARREADIRAEMNRIRDEQIKAILHKCEEDLQELRRRMRKEFQAQIEQKESDFAAAKAELQHQVETWQLKYNEVCSARDATLSHASAEAAHLSVALQTATDEATRKAKEIDELRSMLEKQRLQEESRRSELQHNFSQQLQLIREELNSQQALLNMAESKYVSDVAALKKSKAEELEMVEARVKAAIVKRDGVIASLRAQVEEERAKAETAQRMMVQQRREFMGASFDLST